jgi:hypothetical protein
MRMQMVSLMLSWNEPIGAARRKLAERCLRRPEYTNVRLNSFTRAAFFIRTARLRPVERSAAELVTAKPSLASLFSRRRPPCNQLF